VTYLNVDEVETAISLAAGPANAAFTELVHLPHHTWEGRTCRAIRVGAGGARCGVYLLGGVHAREWGSSDILVNLVRKLTDAYRTGTGITQGGKSFSAADIQAIVNTVDVVVFPQANPDGRAYSMTVDPLWRKNRRPAGPGAPSCVSGGGNGPGVDINRNYDFLWDFPSKFSPAAAVVTSTDPCDQTYRGPSPMSEPETKNVVWLLDHSPNVGYLLDVHSFGEDILYNWGDDDNQTTDPSKNFHNPAFDGQRGVLTSGYGEYIRSADRNDLIALGNAMGDAVHAAHGRTYTVKPSVNLYPTSGTSDDYAFSRHFVSHTKGKILGYTIEWGPARPDVATSFHPGYADMVPIIEEVTAGLLQFCLEAAHRCKARLTGLPDRLDALIAYILFGVIQDGGGEVFVPGRGPVPIGPWGPLFLHLAPETREVLTGLAVAELGRALGDTAAGAELQRLGITMAEKALRGGGPGRQ
jgi:carboxypeptidase T